WVAFLEIGSPSQSVTPTYDLETKNTLIESSLCNDCVGGFGFDAAQSSSYKYNNNISQNIGRYHIYEYGADLIKIDGYNVSHLFGLVDSVNTKLKTDSIVTSIFGLGGLWKININGIGIGFSDNTPNIKLNNMAQAAVLSSSNPQMVFSIEFANNVTNFVGGKFDPQYGYIGPCSSTIFGWVMIGEEPYLINPFDYMYAIPIQSGSTTCYAGFTDTNVVFDIENAQVGFAHTLWGINNT
ncbi:18783_t:CDS:2, partial [Dentiscutata erythropus]